MYRKEGKQDFYQNVLRVVIGCTESTEIDRRCRLVELKTPDGITALDARDIQAKALRVMRGLLKTQADAGIEFTVDDVLYGNEPQDVIELTVEREMPWGEIYVGRRVGFSPDGKPQIQYARAAWNRAQGQFTHGNWFAGGRSYSSFNYVASWGKL